MGSKLSMTTTSDCLPGDANYTLADGWSRKKVAQFIGRGLRMLPPKIVLLGTGIEAVANIPDKLDEISSHSQLIKQAAYDMIAPVTRWSPDIKRRVKDAFNLFERATPEEFRDYIERNVPEAAGELTLLQEMFERIRIEYIVDGVLDPKQRFLNYFPRYRENLGTVYEGTLRIEGGQRGYIPVPIEKMVRPRQIWSAKKRELLDPEDFPKNLTFDDILDVYLSQYSRHASLRQNLTELQDMLAQVPDDYKPYVADIVDHWLGVPSRTRHPSVEAFAGGLRQYQFLRTIGGSILSPLVNTMQRINTFAVVGNKAFMQAFDDMHDPNRLRYAIQAGIQGGLEKVGYERVGPPSRLSNKIAEKLGHLFSESEKSNKLHAFLAGMREAETRGVTDLQKQIAFGRKVMNETQFIMGPANQIPGARGEIGKALTQFQSFRLQQTHFMMRLTDEALQGAVDIFQGIRSGDSELVSKGLNRTLPFAKFWGPHIALGGIGAVNIGNFMDDRAIKEELGGDKWAAAAVGGLPEALLGVTLGHQMGMGAIGLEDLQSFMFYLPGPSIGFFQGLIGTTTGLSAGRGLDLSQVGRELSLDERIRLAVQSAPAGLQVSRAIQFLRLIESDGRYREALDWPTSLGLARTTTELGLTDRPHYGDLLSKQTADAIQILSAMVGFPSSERQEEREKLKKQRDLQAAFTAMQHRAATYIADGQVIDAHKEIRKFNNKYKDILAGPVTVSQDAILAARKRRVTPPGARIKPPQALRTARPFLVESEE